MPSLSAWYADLRARRQSNAEAHAGRDSLLAYARAVYPGYATPPHIVELAELLEAVERGDEDRVILTIPVRHGKSLLAQIFLSWYVARNPRHQIIHASHTAELVTDFGRQVRNTVNDERHQEIFPYSHLAPDSQAAHRWHTSEGGVYIAVGAGGAIAGRGCHLLVLDDVTRGREAADSETQSEKIWKWWRGEIRTRLLPGARIVLIGSRWSDKDLPGRLLDERRARWTVHHRPAINGIGEALCPEFYDLDALEEIRLDVGPREWQAQYQGDPVPDTGVFFERSWLSHGTPPPRSELTVIMASDYAISERQDADYTVHAVVGMDSSDRLWLLDLWRQQASTDRWVEAFVDLILKWRPAAALEEKGVVLKSVAPFIQQAMARRKAACVRHGLTSAVDKKARAQSIRAHMATYGLWLPDGAHWVPAVENELLRFPHGRNDDVVDALSLVGRGLSLLRPPESKPEKAPPGMIDFNDLRLGRGPGLRRETW